MVNRILFRVCLWKQITHIALKQQLQSQTGSRSRSHSHCFAYLNERSRLLQLAAHVERTDVRDGHLVLHFRELPVNHSNHTYIPNHIQDSVADFGLRDRVEVVRVVIGVEKDVILRTVFLGRFVFLRSFSLLVKHENDFPLFV